MPNWFAVPSPALSGEMNFKPQALAFAGAFSHTKSAGLAASASCPVFTEGKNDDGLFYGNGGFCPAALFLDDTIIAQKIYHLLSSFCFWTIFASFFTAFFAILYGCASA